MSLFKNKKTDDSHTYEGRFITEEEIKEMIKPSKKTFIQKEFESIYEKIDEIKQYF